MKKIILLIIFLSLCKSGYATDYCDSDAVGCWYMEDSTTESDESGSGYDLTVASGKTVSTSSTIPSGYSGTSREFQSANAEFLEGANPDLGGANQDLSAVAWIRLATDTTNSTMISKYQAYSNQRGWLIYIEDDGEGNPTLAGCLSSTATSGNVTCATSGETTLNTNTWYHIAMTYDDALGSANLKIYINGSNVGSANTTAGFYNNSTNFRIGARGGASTATPENFFDGLIDEVAVFDRALSSTEINDIMDNGLDGTQGGESPASTRRIFHVL